MPAKILIVDDEQQLERLIRQRFRRQVHEGLYSFLFAQNGQEALDLIAGGDEVDMVLTDINMPLMDGLTLIKRLNVEYPLIRSVIISAYGDMPNIRKAMNYGAFDFLTKPIDFADLETTIEKTLKEITLLREAKSARQLADKNAQLLELDRLKSEFFTNISHEFRTPLTIILGMGEQILEAPEKWLYSGVEMIRRNAFSLLKLVNQILDLRKLEAGRMVLQTKPGDLMILINYLVESFISLSEAHDIRFHYSTNTSRLPCRFDAEKMQQLIANLLSNAVKFTPTGGSIFFDVCVENEQLSLAIKDTGVGISPDQVPYIFDRFFSSEATDTLGTGIGLALVKELVDLMNGSIGVQTDQGYGSRFEVSLPLTRVESDQLTELKFKENPLPGFQPFQRKDHLKDKEESLFSTDIYELPTLLIVEDHEDVLVYLESALQGRYLIRTATDGESGLQSAMEIIPDLIISDVMMPGMNGLEFCHLLKIDPRTDHIPIILLTAKSDQLSKVMGLENGADDYLVKPVDKRELIARLENLLEIRQKLRKRYATGIHQENTREQSGPEDGFIVRLREVVQRNIDDEEFGIIQLCKSLGMSRTQLHRKIKAITGFSTSIFVRYLRLDEARRLLETTDLNVSETAYAVGFSDPKYFSRVFIERFGSPPITFRR